MTVRIDDRLSDVPMVPVKCGRCSAAVLARKSSWNQTSVQWTARALATCLQRRYLDISVDHSGRSVFLGCSALTDSIVGAVGDGDLPVVDETVSTAT